MFNKVELVLNALIGYGNFPFLRPAHIDLVMFAFTHLSSFVNMFIYN